MKTKRYWIIIDCKKSKAIYGKHGITMLFSTEEIAIEVAKKLFDSDFTTIEINIEP